MFPFHFWIQRLGWTLLHFLWQGTAIAAVYAVLRWLFARSLSPPRRYALSCGTLISLTIAPPLTFLLLPNGEAYPTPVIAARVLSFTPSTSEWSLLLNSVVAVWLMGILAFSLRLSGACRFTARLRSASHPASSDWQQILERIGAQMGGSFSRGSRAAILLVSSQVDVPTVIGWLRPAILAPVEFFTGMQADYVTALLAHEMAHIRRHDYLASLLQSLAEAMLFYHPAIWWISAQIRTERELCCDDAAAAVVGDVLSYARALTELEVRQPRRLKPVLAANGGSLLDRIRRLIEPAQVTENHFPGPAAASAMIVLWLAGISVAVVHAATNPAPALFRINHTPDPTTALAAHARKALLYDPFLSAQLSQPVSGHVVPDRPDADRREPPSSQMQIHTAAAMLEESLAAGDVKTLDALLSAGLDPNLRNRFGQTPLYVAVVCDQLKAVRLLLARHADPNEPIATHSDNVREPVTPLQYAARSGKLQIASVLVRAGASVNSTGPAGRTALHYSGNHRLEMTHFLIEQGADVNARDAEGASPLDDAVWSGSLDAVAILLAHGARLNETNALTGASPLNEAAFRGQTEIVQYLLQFHPTLETADKRGYTPLDNAIRMGNEDCALLLLDADQLATDKSAQMEVAIGKDESRVVETLIRRGARVADSLPSGTMPLDEAAFKGAIRTVHVLLNNNANPNLAGRDGTTPLENACLKGFAPVVSLLLDYGAMVNELGERSGTTPLYAAASFGKGDVVKLLLERGANPSLCGKNGKSPYQGALANGYNEVVSQIRNYGGAIACKE